MQRGLAGTAGVYLIGTLLVIAAIERQPTIALIAFMLLVLMALTLVWRTQCLKGVEYRRTTVPNRAFVGEVIELRTEVVNRKFVPLPWLEIDEEIPESAQLQNAHVSLGSKPQRMTLRNLLSMRWFERVTRHYRVLCTARGYMPFGPAVMRSGDIFGFFTDQIALEQQDFLLVYPEVVPLQELGLPTKQPFGGKKALLRIIDDPMRIAGVREYSSGDSLKRIHWKASARTQQLQVKLLEPSADLDLLLFLNVSTFVPDWQGTIPELLEEAIVVTASLADHAYKAGNRVGLYVNTNVPGSDQQVKLPPARDPEHMVRILETLAKVTGFSTMSMDAFLRHESINLPWGATIVLVTAVAPDPMLAALLRLKRSGHKVATVLVGEHDDAARRMSDLNVFSAHRSRRAQSQSNDQEGSELALVQ